MELQQLFQCLVHVRLSSNEARDGILAACGPQLLLLSVKESKILSRWSAQTQASESTRLDSEDEERPAKKAKTTEEASIMSNVIKIAVSPDHKHVVVITDDKCLRVFSIEDGILSELNQRMMPKRPCAVQVLPDNATIICGDKFGDVYSLPLTPIASQEADEEPSATPETEATAKPDFKPSATNLTVHTKRNRRALEAQMQQKSFSARKEPLKFEHKLLLGHVSMLTDMLYATQQVDGKERSYIITADRDEHIRVSRGPSQAHIIEGYCLGHKEFISKLCSVPGTNMLISGGGDDWLGVWDWPSFKLMGRIPLSLMTDFHTGLGEVHTQDPKASQSVLDKVSDISGLWVVPCNSTLHESQQALVIALERCPGLYITPIKKLLQAGVARAFGLTTLTLDLPPLDVVYIDDSIVVSLDARQTGQPRLQAYTLVHQENALESGHMRCERNDELEKRLQPLLKSTECLKTDERSLDGLLYGVANLRKRRDWNATSADGEEDAFQNLEEKAGE